MIGRRRLAIFSAAACAGLVFASGATAAPAGIIAAWGDNSVGELGNGTTTSSSLPVLVTSTDAAGSFSDATTIAAGFDNSVTLLADGTVAAWGGNVSGDLGDGNTQPISVPVLVKGVGGTGTLSGVRSIACGGYACLALRSDGTLVAWGYGGYGQLGDGGTSDSSTPVVVKGLGGAGTLSGVVAIAAGYGHSLALLSDGTVAAWGYNMDGELGQGAAASNSSVPLLVKGTGGTGTLSNVRAIAGGGFDSLALLSDGMVVGWGQDSSGQLGNGTTGVSLTPTPVEGVGGSGTLSGVTAIAGGGAHSLALLSNGTVVAWGNNQFGQLGNGTTTSSSFPVATGVLADIVAIAGGQYHSLAVRSNGTAYAWGNDAEGQLGVDTGGPTQISSPEAVVGVGNFGLLPGVFALPTTDLTNHSLAIEGAFASLSSSSLAFGNQRVGIESAARTLTLTNTGPAPLMVTGETLTGADASSFTLSADSCGGSTLAAGASCRVQMLFVPTSAGAKSATLTFQTTAANALSGVTMTGTGLRTSSSAPPVLSALMLSSHAFRAGPSALTNGTLITYSDSQAAVTTFLVQRPAGGVISNGRCVGPTKHSQHDARRCTRYQTLGRFIHRDRVGLNRVRFTGRVNGRRLAVGRYRLRAIARKNGRASSPRVAGFRIRPPA